MKVCFLMEKYHLVYFFYYVHAKETIQVFKYVSVKYESHSSCRYPSPSGDVLSM